MDIDKELKEPTFRRDVLSSRSAAQHNARARADFQLPHTPNCVYARTHAMGSDPGHRVATRLRPCPSRSRGSAHDSAGERAKGEENNGADDEGGLAAEKCSLRCGCDFGGTHGLKELVA